MKHSLLIIAVVALVGCGNPKVKFVPNSPKAKAGIEATIRRELKKFTGELTKEDLEKVTGLNLSYGEITDVSPLAGLMLLKKLYLVGNKRNVSVYCKHFTGGMATRQPGDVSLEPTDGEI